MVVEVVHDEAPRSTLVFDGASRFTTRRDGRSEMDGAQLRSAIQAGLRSGWRHDQPGWDLVIPWPTAFPPA